jgi:hypothetical protein
MSARIEHRERSGFLSRLTAAARGVATLALAGALGAAAVGCGGGVETFSDQPQGDIATRAWFWIPETAGAVVTGNLAQLKQSLPSETEMMERALKTHALLSPAVKASNLDLMQGLEDVAVGLWPPATEGVENLSNVRPDVLIVAKWKMDLRKFIETLVKSLEMNQGPEKPPIIERVELDGVEAWRGYFAPAPPGAKKIARQAIAPWDESSGVYAAQLGDFILIASKEAILRQALALEKRPQDALAHQDICHQALRHIDQKSAAIWGIDIRLFPGLAPTKLKTAFLDLGDPIRISIMMEGYNAEMAKLLREVFISWRMMLSKSTDDLRIVEGWNLASVGNKVILLVEYERDTWEDILRREKQRQFEPYGGMRPLKPGRP